MLTIAVKKIRKSNAARKAERQAATRRDRAIARANAEENEREQQAQIYWIRERK